MNKLIKLKIINEWLYDLEKKRRKYGGAGRQGLRKDVGLVLPAALLSHAALVEAHLDPFWQ